MELVNSSYEPVARMTRDLRNTAKLLTHSEARYLVDTYYQIQKNRIATQGQARALDQGVDDAPETVLSWFVSQQEVLENQIKGALGKYSKAQPTGEWAESILGIGPVLSAGLLAHIDITKAPTCGHIWNFAGLNPGIEWGKGAKRPWNAKLKTLCWKIGESFVKVSGNPKSFYGKKYKEKKMQEAELNEQGKFAEQAEQTLKDKKYGKNTDAYKAYSQGKLPPAHIHARSTRWAVKLFLSHWHEVHYTNHYGEKPPRPYAIAILHHGHYISPYEVG